MRLMENFKKGKKAIVGLGATAMLMMSAVPAFAANADLDKVTGDLTSGAGDMNTNFLTLVGVVIPIIIVVFGIGWLISLFKRKMNKA